MRAMFRHLFLSILIILSAGCASTNDDVVRYSLQGGECKKLEIELLLLSSPLSSDEVESEILNLFSGLSDKPDPYQLEELEKLKEAKALHGGEYYEISTKDDTWNALHGAWGFGVVNNGCVIYFHQIIVS